MTPIPLYIYTHTHTYTWGTGNGEMRASDPEKRVREPRGAGGERERELTVRAGPAKREREREREREGRITARARYQRVAIVYGANQNHPFQRNAIRALCEARTPSLPLSYFSPSLSLLRHRVPRALFFRISLCFSLSRALSLLARSNK